MAPEDRADHLDDSHSIPTTDIFSYTTQHQAYVPHEWLSQLLIYGAYKLGGYSGMMLWLCCFTSALLIVGYILCSLYARNPKIGLLGALTIWIFSSVGLAIRPHMIGYLLLTIELLLIHLGRTRDRRWFFVLASTVCSLGKLPRLFLSRTAGGRSLSAEFIFFLPGQDHW